MLTPFEGVEVARSKVEIRGVGGGLQEALDFAPIELAKGQRVRVVLDLECAEVHFKAVRDAEVWHRVHVLRLADENSAALVDGDLDLLVQKFLLGQGERIRLAQEQAAGIQRLDDAWDDGEGD